MLWLYGSSVLSVIRLLQQYEGEYNLDKVKNRAKYDIKVKECWDGLMKEVGHDVYFYGSSFSFYFYDDIINPEQFGNILFGAIGNAGGFELYELQEGGSIYSLWTEWRLDNQDDSERIKVGYNLFEQLKQQYSYLHN